MFSFFAIRQWLSLSLLLWKFWVGLWLGSESSTLAILCLSKAATTSWRICSGLCWHGDHELPFNAFNIWIIKREELGLLPFNYLVLVLSVFGFRLHRLIIDKQLVLLGHIDRVLLNLKYRILLMNLHNRGVLLLYLLDLARPDRLGSLFACDGWVVVGHVRLVVECWHLLDLLALFIKALYFIPCFLRCDVILILWSFDHLHLLLHLARLGLPLECVFVIGHTQRFKKGVVPGVFEQTSVFVFHCVLKRLADSKFV